MAKLRVHNFSISLDGYAAGPNQSSDKPFGDVDVPGPGLHDWMFATRTGQQMMGSSGGEAGIDDDLAAAGDVRVGATIMGRNMFGPIRGSWDEMEGLAGSQPALPPSDVRAHPPPARVDRDGRGHDVPLRHRRYRGRVGSGPSMQPTVPM